MLYTYTRTYMYSKTTIYPEKRCVNIIVHRTHMHTRHENIDNWDDVQRKRLNYTSCQCHANSMPQKYVIEVKQTVTVPCGLVCAQMFVLFETNIIIIVIIECMSMFLK